MICGPLAYRLFTSEIAEGASHDRPKTDLVEAELRPLLFSLLAYWEKKYWE